jgi:hypothetical protein
VKHLRLRFGKGFRVVRGNRASQVAEMVLAPGDSEGGADSRHRGADQWLFVVANTGLGLLRTINFYVPPAYRADGNPLPRGKN